MTDSPVARLRERGYATWCDLGAAQGGAVEAVRGAVAGADVFVLGVSTVVL
jgi:hypothetical protein